MAAEVAIRAGVAEDTPNELDIWYTSRDVLHVTPISPTGEATPMSRPGEVVRHRFASGNAAYIDHERFSPLNGDARVYVEVSPGPPGAWCRCHDRCPDSQDPHRIRCPAPRRHCPRCWLGYGRADALAARQLIEYL